MTSVDISDNAIADATVNAYCIIGRCSYSVTSTRPANHGWGTHSPLSRTEPYQTTYSPYT